MKISISSKISKSDALFIFVPEKKWSNKGYGKAISSSLSKQISEKFTKKNKEGKMGEITEIFPGNKDAKRTFIIGYDDCKKGDKMRKSAGVAIRESKKIKASKINFLLPDCFCPSRAVSGAILGDYEFKIGDTSERFSPKTIQITSQYKYSKKDLEKDVILAEATNHVRNLVNLPPNLMTPKILAKEAKKIAKGKLKVKVYGEKDLKKLGMGSFYSVGQGSKEDSQMIVFEYKGGKRKEAPIVFVGKGVTFDSGGYNLKPTGHLETMKQDMAGAATVLGLFDWIAKTKPNKNVVGVIGAVENLVSHDAYKPGDIITAMNKQTIEITNTDAEGRLVLVDCLYYAVKKFKPSLIMDIATLTGAVIQALGYETTAIVGNDDKSIARIQKAAEKADEAVWQLPITDNFREKIKGDISDLINWTAGVNAGTSMAGAFLENFVEKTPWVHFDVAGTAFNEKAGDELAPKGATGVMLRTFSEIVES